MFHLRPRRVEASRARVMPLLTKPRMGACRSRRRARRIVFLSGNSRRRQHGRTIKKRFSLIAEPGQVPAPVEDWSGRLLGARGHAHYLSFAQRRRVACNDQFLSRKVFPTALIGG